MILVDENSIKTLMKNIAIYSANQGYSIAMEHVFNSREINEEKIRHFLKTDNHFIGLDSEVIDFIVETLKVLDE
jgi:hypothetical protein